MQRTCWRLMGSLTQVINHHESWAGCGTGAVAVDKRLLVPRWLVRHLGPWQCLKCQRLPPHLVAAPESSSESKGLWDSLIHQRRRVILFPQVDHESPALRRRC